MSDQDHNDRASHDPWTEDHEGQARQSTGAPSVGGGTWQQEILEKILLESLREQRRARRWGIFFKSLLFIFLFAVLLIFVAADWGGASRIATGPHTALVDVDGVIGADEPANADNIVAGLRAAFADSRTVGVILRINSPGGSPVQAGYVYDEIRRLRAKYPKIPLYAVVTDVCASGAYYIAAAADRIYANEASIVGSIGVRMDSFGFVDAMKKLGIERRLLTSGEDKGMLDPFLPLKADEVRHVQGMLDEIHRQFIAKVKAGRGDRLKPSKDLFSGLIWTGEQGMKLGLVDGLASPSEVARNVIGAEQIKDYTIRPEFFQRVADRIGLALARGVVDLSGVGTLR